MSVYTVGLWRVQEGHADEFVAAWHRFAARTSADFPGATAVLLRDRDDPLLFVSSGPWQSLEQIDAWRSSGTFADGVGDIREHLVSFEPHTMDVAVEIG